MLATKPVGRNARAMKYDILSALTIHALSGDKHRQRHVLRFLALITTRYNWQSNELSIGRAEMARLWAVDERTVKRETAKLREMGWIRVKKPGARGRVTLYEFDLKQILLDTRDAWPVIGPDFEARMQDGKSTTQPDNVVPFQRPDVPVPDATDLWGRVLGALHGRDPELYSTWFRHLSEVDRAGGIVTLNAPSRFLADYIATHLSARILATYSRFDRDVREVRIYASQPD
jgi:DNA-binding MarR family transcriptional regulator